MDPILLALGLGAALAAWRGPMWRGRALPDVRREPPWYLGHRGVRGPLPENTMVAFVRALEAGCDGLETDVQLSRDGRLVLVHDDTVDGTAVGALTAAELAARVPGLCTLDELLELVRSHPGTILNVELKSHGRGGAALARATVGALRGSGLEGRTIVSSFDPIALATVRLVAPALRTGYIWWTGPPAPRLLRSAWPAGWLHVDGLHAPHAAVDAEFVARARRRGLAVHAWTVNDPSEAIRLVSLGATAIISDDPQLRERVPAP